MIVGRGAAPGISIGQAFKFREPVLRIEKKPGSGTDAEMARLQLAMDQTRQDLAALKDLSEKNISAAEAEIFSAHQMILEDPELWEQTRQLLEVEACNVEYAFHRIVQRFVVMFESMDNDYMRSRATDVLDVGQRVLLHLQGQSLGSSLGSSLGRSSQLPENAIVIATDVGPSTLAQWLPLGRLAGLIIEVGGRNSHVAIMARSLGLPAIVGARDATHLVADGDLIAMDGDRGEIDVNPDADLTEAWERRRQQWQALQTELQSLIGRRIIGPEGHRPVTLAANIGSPADLQSALKNDAEGIGLFRTEFLYMDRNSLPSEESQYQSYREVLEAFPNHLCVIRTLDIGGDKKLPYFEIPPEENPFLGLRALRLCLKHPEIFEVQLRALLRASRYGQLAIMFPMVTEVSELLEAKDILKKVKNELLQQGHSVAEHIQVGIMIEVPAAAISAEDFAPHCDFFSIGTNDLIQYTCAVDRMNKSLEHLYNAEHPALWKLMAHVIRVAHENQKWVGVCGELAGNPEHARRLVELGVDELSMSAPSILPVKKYLVEAEGRLSDASSPTSSLPSWQASSLPNF
jgi:phosphoenolpyruvate-protein phosphotransferase (PTS system enzyme I)